MNLLIIFSMLTCAIASSVDIQCEFDYYDFTSAGELYTCTVVNDLKVYTTDVAVNEVKGAHRSGNSNDLISGMVIESKKVEFFPSNLGDKFQNLIGLRLKFGRLKEVHQDDLKGFSKLVHLNLDENNIEALDDDLFEFNTELKVIWLAKNKIKSIGKSIFEKLFKLYDLDFIANACTKERVSGVAKIKPAINKIKQQCFKPDIELENLKLRLQKLKDRNTRSALEIEELKADNMMAISEVVNLKSQQERSCNTDSNDVGLDADARNAAVFNEPVKVNGLEFEASTNQTESIKSNLTQKDSTLAELKFAKKSLERQLKIQILQSQATESNLTLAIDQCEDRNRQFEDLMNQSKAKSEAVERNLAGNIEVLTNKLENLENEKMKLEGTITNLKGKLQAEEGTVNQIKVTNSKNVQQLLTCQRNNTESINQIDKMNTNLQNIKKTLAEERKKSQSKTTEYGDALSAVGSKFDDVKKNLTARFESLYNQTSELLDDQQI